MEINNQNQPIQQPPIQPLPGKKWYKRKWLLVTVSVVLIIIAIWIFAPVIILKYAYSPIFYRELYKTPTELSLRSNPAGQEYHYTFSSKFAVYFQSPFGKVQKSILGNNDIGIFQYSNGKEIQLFDSTNGWFSPQYDQLKEMLDFTPTQLSIWGDHTTIKKQESLLFDKLTNGFLWGLPDLKVNNIYFFENKEVRGFEFYNKDSATAKLYLFADNRVYLGTVLAVNQPEVESILSSIHFAKNDIFDFSFWQKTYIAEWGLHFFLPPDWNLVSGPLGGPYLYEFSDVKSESLIHDVATLHKGTAWISINKAPCGETTTFVDQSPTTNTSEKIFCLRDLKITQGFWNDNPNRLDDEKLLNSINPQIIFYFGGD